ncbi:MFS transporter [Stenotrophomonas koreensis]|uniref:MFS transporter n=1 Tax=Stenotrophomonas koreensis TaxID=266128 RepID=UPI00339ABC99
MSATAPVDPSSTSSARAIAAAVAGTVFEWFDFFLYGSLAVVLGRHFFPSHDGTAGLLAALAVFGAGWVVRPLGALVFGRMGDRIGRRQTFLVTIVLMGLSTVAIGLLPTHAQIGLAAPVLLVILRLLQGLAVGGEFGGAATYVAEYSSPARRGLNTSLVMATGTLGLLLALATITLCRQWLGADDFQAWGWRLPFLASFGLLALSVYMRLHLAESPAFEQLQREGRVARSPLREVFGNAQHRRTMLLALVTLTAAQGVVWNAGQYYPLVFLQAQAGLDVGQAGARMMLALLLAAPLFPLAGWLSDRIGRRPVIIAGFLLAGLGLLPVFAGLLASTVAGGGWLGQVGWLWLLSLPVALVCGPASAYLVELFPTHIRYSAIGLPYHLGNGWFGGFMPLATAAVSAHYASPLAGLVYPTVLALACGLAALRWMPETRGRAL